MATAKSGTHPAIIMAGIPATNAMLYHRIRFLVGDPVAVLEIPRNGAEADTTLILRDIELERARKHARATHVTSPTEFTPAGGLSGDRETATAQAAAECLRRAGVKSVVADRSLPLIFAELVRRAGIDVECDLELGVLDRRAKDEQEVAWLRKAQEVTEGAMQMACELVARATARADGALRSEGEPLTSERVRATIDRWLLDRNFESRPSIVACGPEGADCHNLGAGALRTGQPVIIDIFPRDRETHYNGDCTRTVVHGEIPDEIVRMHKAVVEAKAAATAASLPGVTGEAVHKATAEVIARHGYNMGFPPDGAPDTYCSMVHGTGHGVGLDVHEPPLLDKNGPPLVAGDILTIEPGLYCKAIGGVRVEDMVVVRAGGCENLDRLHEGLVWR